MLAAEPFKNWSRAVSVSAARLDDDDDICTFKKWAEQPNQPGFFRIFTIISVLTILVVLVVLGNALVIAAVVLRRRLRSATGLLILSLAVADLMVGLVILPFSIANEVLHSYWIFGDTWCTMWLTMDIWMCTASIYNLVAISIDRYIAIIKPLNYPMLITKFRARCIVASVWVGSFFICSPSFLLASSEKKSMGKDSCRCTPANSGMAYIVFSASSSFYIPMIIVIFVYVRIYIAACAATKSVYSGMMQVTASANKNPKNLLMQNPSALSRGETAPILRVHRGSTIKNTTSVYNEPRFARPNRRPPVQELPLAAEAAAEGHAAAGRGLRPRQQQQPHVQQGQTAQPGRAVPRRGVPTAELLLHALRRGQEPARREQECGPRGRVGVRETRRAAQLRERDQRRRGGGAPAPGGRRGRRRAGPPPAAVGHRQQQRDRQTEPGRGAGAADQAQEATHLRHERAVQDHAPRPAQARRLRLREAAVAGDQGGQDSGHRDRLLHLLLAGLQHPLRILHPDQRGGLVHRLLAGLLELGAQPRHLHRVQPRVPHLLQATAHLQPHAVRIEYNSYNSTLRPGKPHMAGYSSVVSAPPYLLPTRSSPPNIASEETR